MSDRLFVGTRKGLFTATRGASGQWSLNEQAFVGYNVSMLLPDRREGRVYAAVEHGHFGTKLHASKDAGKTWQECAVPEYPPLPPGREPDKCPMRGIEIPWALKMIWILEAGGADEDGVLWCGTIPGGLFRSNDRGGSWQFNRVLWDLPNRANWMGGGYDYPGIHSVCVDPRDAGRVTVGVSCGSVWTTEDGGETWRRQSEGLRADYTPPEQAHGGDVQDPHRLVQCTADPEAMWIQHHNGIFRSTDGGESWHEIKSAGPSTFGFAAAVHPVDGKMAWFVPAVKDDMRVPADNRVVVTRTRDGGQSFDVLDDGLPRQRAFDIVYRHGLDVDPAGQRLAVGSTTGSLWLSENQGDSWQHLSTHLPPVYCVRFA